LCRQLAPGERDGVRAAFTTQNTCLNEKKMQWWIDLWMNSKEACAHLRLLHAFCHLDPLGNVAFLLGLGSDQDFQNRACTEIVGKPPPYLQAEQQGHGSQAYQQDTAIGSIEVLANEGGHRGLLL